MKVKIALICGYFALNSVILVFLIPPFEAPDEGRHVIYINYVSRNLALPNQLIPEKTAVGQGHQYPFYYILGALILRMSKSDGFIHAEGTGNKRHVLSGGDSRFVPSFEHLSTQIFKGSGDAVSFYALRLFSMVIGAISILFLFWLAKVYIPDFKWQALAVFWAASLPQFIYGYSTITNDGLACLFATMSFYFLSKLAFDDDAYKMDRYFILAGLSLALAILTKKNSLVLLGPAAYAFMEGYLRRKRDSAVRGSLRPVLVAILVFVGMTAWFFIRNASLYGDILGTRMELATLGSMGMVDPHSLLSPYFLGTFFPQLLVSFIGVFSYGSFYLPSGFYFFFFALGLLGIFGLFRFLYQRRAGNAKIFFLIASVALSVGAVIYYNLNYFAPTGRYLFPVMGPLVVLFGLSLSPLFSRIKSRLVRDLVYFGLLAIFVVIDIATYVQAYHFFYDPLQYARW